MTAPPLPAGWVLDTHVISELARPRPDPRLLTFWQSLERVVTSAIVLYELERGVAMLPRGRRRTELSAWLQGLLGGEVEILGFDASCARRAAQLEAEASRRGRPIEVRDALVLGAAAASGLGVATRNTGQMAGHGVPTVNPFDAT